MSDPGRPGGSSGGLATSARAVAGPAGRARALPHTTLGGGSPWWRWARRALPLVVLTVVLVVAPALYDNLSFLTTMVVYIILAEGVNLIYGFTGYLPFGYVGFFGAGAYGSSLAISYWHVPGVLGSLIGGLLAALVGLVLSPLLRLSGAYFALATMAASQALYYIVVNEP